MKKNIKTLFGILLILPLFLASCSKHITYADMLKDENNAISLYIKKQKINVIDVKQFNKQGDSTSVEKNEYVHLQDGVYMQIVSKGDMSRQAKNNDEIIVRASEYNILTNEDTYVNSNDVANGGNYIRYTKDESRISGSFMEGPMLTYGPAVPAGWLAPLIYIGNYAHVRLIVPSKSGTNKAMQNVVPFYYDLTQIQIY